MQPRSRRTPIAVTPHRRADDVVSEFIPWPIAPGAYRHPIGPGLIAVMTAASDDFRTFHAWFDPAARLTRNIRRGHGDPYIAIQLDGPDTCVSVYQIRYDQGDEVLVEVRLPRDLPVTEPVGQPFLQATAFGIVDAVATALTADHPALADDVVHLSSDVIQRLPPSPDEWNSQAVNSWHLHLDGQTTRAIEACEIFDADIEHVRARTLKVYRGHTANAELLVCPLDGPARFWPQGTHPHLDAPRTGRDLPTDVAAIATAVATEPPRT